MRRLLLIAGILLLATSFWSYAMELDRNSDPYAPCLYRLTGFIERGDAKKVEQQFDDVDLYATPDSPEEGNLEAIDFEYLYQYIYQLQNREAICLNSRGGDFREAINIGHLLVKLGLSTVIYDGNVCLSACSAIFFSGSVVGDVGRYPSRYLHVGGTLGLHRPSLRISGSSDQYFTVEEIGLAYSRANEDISEFLGLLFQSELPVTLIAQMMTTDSETYFYVDTVGKAGLWGFWIFGHPEPGQLDAADFAGICGNAFKWMNPFNLFEDMSYREQIEEHLSYDSLLNSDDVLIEESDEGTDEEWDDATYARIGGFGINGFDTECVVRSPSSEHQPEVEVRIDRPQGETILGRWSAQASSTPLSALRAPNVPNLEAYVDLVSRVQGELIRLGYDPGRVDGDVGPRTRAALARFQEDNGLVVTRLLTAEVVDRLRDHGFRP